MNKSIFSIIIVSWNVKDLLDKCLNSLYQTQQNVDFEVIVIDNASQDGSVEMVNKKYPQVKLIANKQNKGFAFACHQGANIAQGEYFLFLNDDTELVDNTLDKVYAFLQNKENLGVLGVKILNQDGTIQKSVRKFPSLGNQLVVLLKLSNFFPKLLKNYLMFDFDYQKTQKVDQVMGAFFLVPKKIWQKFFGFDKKFFIWYEEVDFCKQIKNVGLEVIYFSEAVIKHNLGASFKQLPILKKQIIFNRSLLRFAKKYFSFIEYFILLLFIPFNMLLTLLFAGFTKLKLNFSQ